MEPISAIAATSLQNSAINSAVDPSMVAGGADPGAVDPGDQLRFETAMFGPSPDATVAADSVSKTQSIGDAMIEGLQNIKSSYDLRAERVQEKLVMLADNPMNLQEAMGMQFELMQLNLQQELTSKMADKTSQGVQTLFRNQG